MARPRSDIQPRIVHAARARFVAEGVDGASLRTIARDARTNIGMVVYYFPTKEHLFLAVIEEVYAELLRDLTAILEAATSLRTRLRRASVRLGTMSDDELAVVRLVAREALVSSARFRKVLARFRRGHIPLVMGALGDAAVRGEVDARIPLPLLVACTFGVIGVPQIVRRAAKDEPPFALLPEPEAIATIALGILFDGIGARRPRRPSPDPPRPRRMPRAKAP